MSRVVVVVPNWNGADKLIACLDSLQAQSLRPHIFVIDNGSIDGSVGLIENSYPEVELIRHKKNKGYAGGVNPGFRRAIEMGADYAAPFNNDAVADKDWLKNLVNYLDTHPKAGIAACKLLSADGKAIDSTGDYYSVWGLPWPRGRGETAISKYDNETDIFGASGGASLYRVKMLEQVGLFDEDFFAYYEDVDLSFRARLSGWLVAYVPSAVVNHQLSATSSLIRGFATYQTLKNLPQLWLKNVPRRYLFRVGWRLAFAQTMFFGRAITRGHAWAAIKGGLVFLWLLPKTLSKRSLIQKNKRVGDDYIWQLLLHDLPPNARALRSLRRKWRKLFRKK